MRESTQSATALVTRHADAWPELPPLSTWRDTLETLHRWTQIVGKVRLGKMPWINHAWHVPLYVTSRGLTTSAIPCETRALEIEFDFIDHRLHVATSDGESHSFKLEAMSVAAFYRKVRRALDELDIQVHIWPTPVEIPDPIEPFFADYQHAAYDPGAVARYWRVLLSANRVFTEFRARFTGKVSPVHLFWGAFDLAVTRFSGRTAPKHPGGAPNCPDWVMQEAYSHEVSSAGFWPGTGLGEPAFYSYAYPEPEGFRKCRLRPAAAYYHETLGEFILPYEAVRTAADPDATLMVFLQSTYEAAADLAEWDRGLESTISPRDSIARITRDRLRRKMAHNDPFVLVEVLEPEDYESFHLPGAIDIPLDDLFEEKVAHVLPDKSQAVVVYSRDERCSASRRAAKRLEKLGYQRVSVYEAGKDDWRSAGLHVEQKKSA